MMVIDLSGVGISPKKMSEYLLDKKIFTREGEYTSRLVGESEYLLDKKIFTREGEYTSRLVGDKYLRISFSIPEEGIKKFCEEFPKAVEALKK